MAEIKVLGELEHIRKRPGMYIGETKNPTHLVEEVLDNALDELLNNFATTVWIDFDDNGNVSIADNGRGFPVHEVILPDGSKESSVVAAVARLFSGAKFDDNTYNMSKGTHGVGLSAVNALSHKMSLTIKDRNNANLFHYYAFSNGALIQNIKKELKTDIFKFSTKVQFQIDEKYFETLKIDVDRIKRGLFLIGAKFPKSKLYLNNKLLENSSMDNYVRWMCKIYKDTPVFKVEYTTPINEKVEIYFTFEHGNSYPIGDVNLGICDGTYLQSFATIFYNIVKSSFSSELTRTDVLNGLKYYISLTIKEPKYDSQNKTRMVKNVHHIIGNSKIKNQLVLKLGEDHIRSRLNNILSLKKGKELSKILKVQKRVSTNNPLKDCKKTPGDILYILEGDSAEGTLKQIRDANTQAILPVNGKIANSIDMTIDKAVGTKLKYMLEAIGVDPNDKNAKYRYDKVKVICDADPDGLHISVLVSIAIWKFAPKLIEDKKFSIILPPLYGASKKNKFIPIYNQNYISKYIDDGYIIKRFKGLGEMNAQELDLILQNPIEYIAEPPKNKKEEDLIYALITDSSLKKRVCSNSNFSLESLSKKILNA